MVFCIEDAVCVQNDEATALCECPVSASCNLPDTDALVCISSANSTLPTDNVPDGGICTSDVSCLNKFCQSGNCVNPNDPALQIAEGEHCPSGFNSTCRQPQTLQNSNSSSLSAACLCPASADCSTGTDPFVCSIVNIVVDTPPTTGNITDAIDCACEKANPNNCLDLGPLQEGQYAYCGPPIEQLPPGSLIGMEVAPDPNHVPPQDPDFTDDELDTFKTMELSTLAAILKAPMQGEQPVDLPYCGLESQPSERQKRGLFRNIFKFAKRPKRPVVNACPRSPLSLTVKVQFTVVSTTRANNVLVTDQATATAIEELNNAYKGMGISFEQLGGIWRRSARSEGLLSKSQFEDYQRFARFPDEAADAYELEQRVIMSADGRRGITKDVMNIFIVEEIVNKAVAPARVMGHCYYVRCPLKAWPQNIEIDERSDTQPEDAGQIDGCVITMDSMTGVVLKDAGTRDGGATLIHEAGHWFGLRHVFDGEKDKTCQGRNHISGIPQYLWSEKFQTVQRPCTTYSPLQPQSASVLQLNYMSYSPIKGQTCQPSVDDFCQYGSHLPWTSEQAAAAYTNYYMFRKDRQALRTCFGYDTGAVRAKRLKTRGHDDSHAQPSLYQRLLQHRRRMMKRDLLEQRPNVVQELTAICQTPYTPDDDPVIEAVLPDADSDARNEPAAVPFSISGGTQTTLSDGRIQINLDVKTTDESGATITSVLPLITQSSTAVAKQGPTPAPSGRTVGVQSGAAPLVVVTLNLLLSFCFSLFIWM
ncbi:hypothetical protein OIV83_003713 [Microbotryomycetes sp. JL201]|nr:hypothetical protein OIV83_003713 [Microbotryomycetes sp. JL201]